MKPLALRATPPGEGGIHVLLLVGAGSREIVASLFEPADRVPPNPGQLVYGRLHAGGEKLDEAIVRALGPGECLSGEEAFEISVHGGMAVAGAALRAMEEGGAGLGEAADYLERARGLGALDRIRAEAWEHLLEAKTEAAARFLVAQAAGSLSSEVRALTEGFEANDSRELPNRIDRLLRNASAGLALTQAKRIVLAGPTNAGKSTLFNAICGFERVLAAPLEGTTRDPVRETVSFGGYPFRLVDTAGFREGGDELERLGARRAEGEVADADLVVFIFDGSLPLDPEARRFLDGLAGGPPVVLFRNKTDLGTVPLERSLPNVPLVASSALREPAEAASALSLAALRSLSLPAPPPTGGPYPFTARQVRLLRRAADDLSRGEGGLSFLREMFT